MQKIKAASEQYIDTEKKKRERAYQGSRTALTVGTSHQGALGSGWGGEWGGPYLQDAAVTVRGRWGVKDQTCCRSAALPTPLPPRLFQTSWASRSPSPAAPSTHTPLLWAAAESHRFPTVLVPIYLVLSFPRDTALTVPLPGCSTSPPWPHHTPSFLENLLSVSLSLLKHLPCCCPS